MSNGNGYRAVSINLGAEEHRVLEDEANKSGISVSALVRIFARSLMVSAPAERPVAEVRDDIRNIIKEELHRAK